MCQAPGESQAPGGTTPIDETSDPANALAAHPVLHDTHGLAAASRLTFQLFGSGDFSIGLSIT